MARTLNTSRVLATGTHVPVNVTVIRTVEERVASLWRVVTFSGFILKLDHEGFFAYKQSEQRAVRTAAHAAGSSWLCSVMFTEPTYRHFFKTTFSKLHCGSVSLKIRFAEVEWRRLTRNLKRNPRDLGAHSKSQNKGRTEGNVPSIQRTVYTAYRLYIVPSIQRTVYTA